MTYPSSKLTQRNMGQNKADSLELEKPSSIGGSITSFAKDTTNKIGEGFGDLGKGIFNDLIGNTPHELTPQEQYEKLQREQAEAEQPKATLERGNLFNFRSIEDQRKMQEIHEVIEQIRVQVDQVKKMNKDMINKIKDIENETINAKEDKASAYDLNVFKLFSSMLELYMKDLSKASNWMDTFVSKKAKRGSAFATRSKKAGTSYSMSQELQSSRSIQ